MSDLALALLDSLDETGSGDPGRSHTLAGPAPRVRLLWGETDGIG